MHPLTKKILLSLSVITAFVGYSWYSRHEQDETKVTPPTALQPEASASPSGSAAPTGSPAATPASTKTGYKDGTYTGPATDAYYGNIQVRVKIQGGKITDVTFLQYPNDREESIRINQQAMPYLKQEAIQAQAAQVDGVSGATDTSQAFIESMSSALNQAKS